VTPSEKPSRNGQEAAAPEAERTTVLDSAAEDAAAEAPAASGGPEGNGQANGQAEPPKAPAPPGSEVTDDLELGHGAALPPWQRVANDAAYARPEQPAEQPVSTVSGAALFDPPTVDQSAPERPVVTGTAAARMFGGKTGAPPPGGYAPPPPRTTVHLEGANATTGVGAMRPTAAVPPNVLRRPGRGPRRANLQIKRFDPWSVLKLSLVLGVALFFVWLVAVGALYAVLDGMGVWDKVNGISTDLLQGNEGTSEPLISAGRVFGVAAIVGAVNIVLFSALATVGAFVYNVSADLAGGLEVTLAERE
jgi:hypothetical protein